MAAPIGNLNAAKGKMFYDALRKNLTQNPGRLAAIVEKLLVEAENGEPWAIKEVIDRLDGKAVQLAQIAGEDGQPLLSGIQITFVKPPETIDV